MAETTIGSMQVSKEESDHIRDRRFEDIDEMFRMARPGRGCFRKSLLNYFSDSNEGKRKSFANWIIYRLFSSRSKKSKMSMCCDFCNGVTAENFQEALKRTLNWTVERPKEAHIVLE
jgi:hypothetical protein